MSNQILISSGAKLRDLDDVIIGTDGVLTSLGFNVANGVPKLDENGKILVSQLPNSVMEFKGVWNAATNTPTLANGTGNAGDVYLCNVAGTVNFGAGPIAFAVGDYAVYTGTVWARSSGATGTVTSVGLSRDGDALTVTGSPITTSGTINIGFAGTNLQYINGAGNLVTFPTIATEAQRLITEVYNETGATLAKGSIVYINGGHGNLPTVTKAIATGDATSAQTYGIVQNDIGNNNNGFVVVIGSLTDLDTQAYPEGTQLYLSGTTAGAWTSTKPYAPVHLVYVAIVTRSHPTQGVVEVSIQNGYEMDELHNVAAQNPDNNDILQYKTSTSLWTKVAGTTSNIAEGSNLYFTDARSRAAISLTTTGSTGAATYDNVTGVLNIPNYVDQYVGTVTSVGLSAPTGFSVTGSPVTSSGTLALSFASGYSLPTNVKQSNWDDAYTWVAAFPTQTGNAGKFLTTDGSSLSWAANPLGTVTSVAMSVPTGLTVTGSPITSAGTLAVTFTAGYSIPTNASQTNWDTAYTNRITSLTTTGSSGAATLISNTLNVPTYTLAGLGGVPTTRTLTINSVTYDLSADRTWTITAGISSVSGTSPISVSTVGGAATVSIATANTTTTGALTSTDWNTFNNKLGVGFVSSGTLFARAGFTTYRDHTVTAANDATIKSLSNTEDNWIYCDSANAQFGIYHRNIDTDLVVAGQPTLPNNSIAYIGNNVIASYVDLINGNGFFRGNLTANSIIKNGGTASQFLKADGSVDSNSYALASALGNYLPLTGGTLTGNTTLNKDNGYFIFNRSAIDKFLGIAYQTAASPKWFVGLRETSTNNYIIYNEVLGLDIFTINAANSSALLQYGNFGAFTTSTYSPLTVGGRQVSWGESATFFPAANGYITIALRLEGTDTTTGTWSIGKQSKSSEGYTVEYLQFAKNGLTGGALHRADAVMTFDPANGNALFGFNVGIGVGQVLSNTYPALQIARAGFMGAGNEVNISSNGYYTSPSWKYIATDTAALYNIAGNSHVWYTAPSGTINSAISWTERFRISSTGLSTFTRNESSYGMVRLVGSSVEASIGYRFPTDTDATSWVVGKGAGLGDTTFGWYYGGIKMILTTGGSLLVNTGTGVSGGGTLQVNGDVNINGNFKINGTIIGGGGGSGVTGSGTSGYITKWTGSSTLANSVMYDNGTNVGISATTVPEKLTVGGNILSYASSSAWAEGLSVIVPTVATWGGIRFRRERSGYDGNWGIGYVGFDSTDDLVFISNNAGSQINNILRLTKTGNVLINSGTDNGYKLQINGSTSFAYGYFANFKGSTNANDILFGNTGSTLESLGNFKVQGTTTSTGGFFDTSDARLKTLVEDNYLLSSIANVKAKLYKKNGVNELGYYAQDLEAILPSAVNEGSDGFLSLSYAQVHTAKIAVIEDEVTILKNRVSELETKLKNYDA